MEVGNGEEVGSVEQKILKRMFVNAATPVLLELQHHGDRSMLITVLWKKEKDLLA